jgi:hypothetical protein
VTQEMGAVDLPVVGAGGRNDVSWTGS